MSLQGVSLQMSLQNVTTMSIQGIETRVLLSE